MGRRGHLAALVLSLAACNRGNGISETTDSADADTSDTGESSGDGDTGDECADGVTIGDSCATVMPVSVSGLVGGSADVNGAGGDELLLITHQDDYELRLLEFDPAGSVMSELTVPAFHGEPMLLTAGEFREPGQVDVLLAVSGRAALYEASPDLMLARDDEFGTFRFSVAAVVDQVDVTKMLGTSDDGLVITQFGLDGDGWVEEASFQPPDSCAPHQAVTLDADGDGTREAFFAHHPSSCGVDTKTAYVSMARWVDDQIEVTRTPVGQDLHSLSLRAIPKASGGELLATTAVSPEEHQVFILDDGELKLAGTLSLPLEHTMGGLDLDGDLKPDYVGRAAPVSDQLLLASPPYSSTVALEMPGPVTRMLATGDFRGDGNFDAALRTDASTILLSAD